VVRLEKEYRFDTDDGEKTLGELFDGRSQLLVYHFMFGPHYTAGCPICSSTADSFNGVLPHLEACGVTTICVSRAPLENLLAFRQRMGWSFNWASSYKSDFNLDFGVSATEKTTRDVPRLLQGNEVTALPLLDEQRLRDNPPLVAAQYASATGTDVVGYLSEGHGVSTFARESNTVYNCYSSYARGTEFLMGYYAILDRTPKGRDEGDAGQLWVRRHDEYDGS
jgi:predicted dithiol-disulfide oxidoreductase (DUF899 family)